MRPDLPVRLFGCSVREFSRRRAQESKALPALSRRRGGHGGLGRYDAGLPGGDRTHAPAGSGEDCDAVATGRRLAKSKPRLEGARLRPAREAIEERRDVLRNE